MEKVFIFCAVEELISFFALNMNSRSRGDRRLSDHQGGTGHEDEIAAKRRSVAVDQRVVGKTLEMEKIATRTTEKQVSFIFKNELFSKFCVFSLSEVRLI